MTSLYLQFLAIKIENFINYLHQYNLQVFKFLTNFTKILNLKTHLKKFSYSF